MMVRTLLRLIARWCGIAISKTGGSEMNDKIRVGLIGYGYASKTFHAPLIMGTPGLELAAVSSSDETKVKAEWPAVTAVSEPRHLFNDPHIDLLVLPPPDDTHFPRARAALAAGREVGVDEAGTVTR
ncbi:oxidoreductase, partial [Salmonella enterica subsp. enterica serovar Wilhelmsburg]